MGLFDEVSIRLSHKISKRIDLTKEAVTILALARLIYELKLEDLYSEAEGILDIIEKLNPSIGLKGIIGDTLAINNILDKIMKSLDKEDVTDIKTNAFFLKNINEIRQKIIEIEKKIS